MSAAPKTPPTSPMGASAAAAVAPVSATVQTTPLSNLALAKAAKCPDAPRRTSGKKAETTRLRRFDLQRIMALAPPVIKTKELSEQKFVSAAPTAAEHASGLLQAVASTNPSKANPRPPSPLAVLVDLDELLAEEPIYTPHWMTSGSSGSAWGATVSANPSSK